MLQIKFKSKKIESECTDADVARKHFGQQMAEKIQQRMAEIESADNVEQMIQFKVGRCHHLKGDRKNQYAVDLVQPFRLIFTVKSDLIEIAVIKEIIDYH